MAIQISAATNPSYTAGSALVVGLHGLFYCLWLRGGWLFWFVQELMVNGFSAWKFQFC